jgi:hypothetical protein
LFAEPDCGGGHPPENALRTILFKGFSCGDEIGGGKKRSFESGENLVHFGQFEQRHSA